MVSLSEIHNKHATQAFKTLIRHSSPTLGDVHKQICIRKNCPMGNCTFPSGPSTGRDCGHVISVKLLIDKILDLIRK